MTRRLGQILVEAVRGLVRGGRSSALALAAIISAVMVLGAFLVLSRAVDDTLSRWAAAAEISVFISDDASAEARTRIERLLREHPGVSEIHTVDSDEARRRFVERFPDLAPLLSGAGEGPLPVSVEARIGLVNPADLATLADRLRGTPGVSDVRVDQELLAKVMAWARAGRLVGGTLSAILVLAAALAVSSVVRLSYVARHDEVEVMYLLGAPLSAIRGPFVMEGAIQGALGTGLALGLLAVAQALLVRGSGPVPGDLPVRFLPWWIVAVVVGGGVVMGAWAGRAAVREARHGAGE